MVWFKVEKLGAEEQRPDLLTQVGLRVPWRDKAGLGRMMCFAIAASVAGQGAPQAQTHLSMWVLLSGWELTARWEK